MSVQFHYLILTSPDVHFATHRGSLVLWKANARARLQADGILNQVFIFFLFFHPPMSRPPGCRRPPRALSSLSSGHGADKTPGIEVVGNNISVGVVMVAEY